jgi:hypothetical protein
MTEPKVFKQFLDFTWKGVVNCEASLLFQVLVDVLGNVRVRSQDILHLFEAFCLVVATLPSHQHAFQLSECLSRMIA